VGFEKILARDAVHGIHFPESRGGNRLHEFVGFLRERKPRRANFQDDRRDS